MTKELARGFTVQVDGLDKNGWDRIIAGFDDAYIYQTWSYEAVHSGEKSLSHLVLKKEGAVVAAAQLRVVTLPLVGARVAYLRWGPMWHPKGRTADPEVFSQALRALRNEYVVRRGLVLRVLPFLFDDDAQLFAPVFAQEKFSRPLAVATQKTLLIDLQQPVEALRKGLHEKWRYNLKQGEKHNPTVLEGTEDELFPLFIQTYSQTRARKGFVETSDINEFRRMQRDLPDEFRLRIWVALQDDTPAAGVICNKIGSTGLFLFGGVSDVGLNTRASHLLNWRAMLWLKEQGATCYNLAGINAERNPGTYRFKTGLCGKNGREVSSLGAFDSSAGIFSGNIFKLADLGREMQRRGRLMLTKPRTSAG